MSIIANINYTSYSRIVATFRNSDIITVSNVLFMRLKKIKEVV